jgi:peptidoglycan glycosyltransferase
MNHQVKRVATAMLVLFLALVVNVNLLQLVRGPALADNPANRRLLVAQYGIERGPILVADEPVAESVPTVGELEYLRTYLEPELYAHTTGHDSVVQGRTGLERVFNEHLTGAPTEALAQNLTELLVGRDTRGNTLRLTLDPQVQQVAREALDGRTGAVVAMEPTTGRVLAAYGNPTYDPNRLASHDPGEVLEAFNEYRLDPDQPLLDRVTRVTWAPGSVFKVVVAAAALESGMGPDTAFDNQASYTPPGTSRPIANVGDQRCGEGATISLAEAFRVSCNSVFAQLAVTLGTDAVVSTAQAMGFNRALPYELPVVNSVVPPEMDPPALAQSGIGQRDVRMTAIEGAMLAAIVANEGVAQRPWVVSDVLSPSGRVVQGSSQGVWREPGFSEQAISRRTATQLRELMVVAVANGTGTAAAIEGVEVGGKTGTAQDPNLDGSIAWFVGFAGDRVAVSVVLPDVDGGGGSVAAPVARAVMQAALQ